MAERMKIAIGAEFFAKIREGGYYYVDKTGIIHELLTSEIKATVITRPRRFGKTLTMTMLEDFLDISRESRAHFEGLAVSREAELCEKWQNKCPTIFFTCKKVEGLDFATAMGRLEKLLADLCRKYDFLATSEAVDAEDRETFKRLRAQTASRADIADSLVMLSRMMQAHYGRGAVLLIDEYDVPLAKAGENGYYREMLDIMRAMLGSALKTNPHLDRAVLTGCLRISKESIFTGLNNLVVDDITGGRLEKYIGFTPAEVEKLLADTGMEAHAPEIREWYDGYLFGETEIYCPWSLLSHLYAVAYNPRRPPEAYWANTSHNGVIYHYITRRLRNVKGQLDQLMAGGSIISPIEANISYDYIKSTPSNFWSLLYLTGYLTRARTEEELPWGTMALRIPNKEVRKIFKTAIIDWLADFIETVPREEIQAALFAGDAPKAAELISRLLFKTISYHDYYESFYHAFLAGLFAGDLYAAESNLEYGLGRPDLVVKDDDECRAIVMEMKRARTKEEIPEKMAEARQQIKDRRYMESLDEGYRARLAYAVVFYKKQCFLEKL